MRSRAEAGECPQDRRAPSRRSRSCTNLPGGKGLAGSWSRTQEGGDALRLPGTLTGTCARGECAELPKGCSAHCGTRSSSEGLGRRLRGGGCAARERDSTSAGSGAQGAGTQPRIRPPPGQAEAGRAQDSEDAPAPS